MSQGVTRVMMVHPFWLHWGNREELFWIDMIDMMTKKTAVAAMTC